LTPGVSGGGEPLPTGEAFNPAWIDFEHGIRVGRLEPHERITQILKFFLESTYGTRFVTDRWGRGVFWRWICWLPKENRLAKPVSSSVNYGCAKLFVTTDRGRREFRCGLQVERGYVRPPEPGEGWVLKEDWDWHRLVGALAGGSVVDNCLERLLVREGFVAEIGDWQAKHRFSGPRFAGVAAIREAACGADPAQWAGFQLYLPMPEAELRACTGLDFIRSVCGVFRAVVPVMNACMQIRLTDRLRESRPPWDRD
jgi:hypothetical protein